MGKIAFIGMGNMGKAMLFGCMQVFEKKDLIFTSLHEENCKAIKEETGVEYTRSIEACIEAADYIVLAVKPQVYPAVLEKIKSNTEHKIIISIAPNYTIDQLKDILGKEVRIVRAMPNTPAMVGEGMSGISFSGDLYSEEEKISVMRLFDSFGRAEVIDEKLMSAVVAASGSSPAFVYMFIEALADSAVQFGMPRNQAYQFVAQTVLGSAKMVLETGEHPGKLKDNVCSPGGTTIEGVAALESKGFRGAVMDGASAVYHKCTNM